MQNLQVRFPLLLSLLWLLLFAPLLQAEVQAEVRAEVRAPVIRGEWQQGAILVGQLPPGYRLDFLGKPVPMAEDGVFVLGLGRDFPSQARLRITSAEGQVKEMTYPVAQRDYQIQRVNGVPAKTVNPDPEHLARIRAEAILVSKARQPVSSRQDFRATFRWPLLGPITGVYGSQRYYNGEPRRPHFGVDVAAPVGTRVVAPASGKVVLAHDDLFFSGGTLIVDHGQGLSSTFIHLNKILVAEGELITQGQAIAEVGATGRATGAHLDWRMNWMDQRVDPQTLVPAMAEALARIEEAADSALQVK